MTDFLQKLGLGDSWIVYEGEVGRCSSPRTATQLAEKPIWSVKKHVSIIRDNVLGYVYRGSSSTEKRNYSYVIEGSYGHRSCKVMDESRKVVAEIKRKEAMVGGVSFGLEVFLLVVQPGFDPGFASEHF